MKRLIVLLIVMVLFTTVTYADLNEVEVIIPEFGVTIGEETIDNEHNEYPLIVYNDITYFPMTWNFSRSLGLLSNWNSETGLTIGQSSETEELIQDKSVINDLSKTYSAMIADFYIDLNGSEINNSEEDYPILVFRDITYFPLTWKFTVDEFGWESGWDANKGLSIANNNIKTTVNIDASSNNATTVSDVNNSSVAVSNNNIDNSVNDSNNVYNDHSTNITNNIDNSLDVSSESKLDALLAEIQKLNETNISSGSLLISLILKDNDTNEVLSGATVYLNDMPVGVSDGRGIVEIEVYKYAKYAIEIKHNDYYSTSFEGSYNDSQIVNQMMINKSSSNIIIPGDSAYLQNANIQISSDGRIILNTNNSRLSIKSGSLVKDLVSIVENIEGVIDVLVWHDNGSEASMTTEIRNVHNLTVKTTSGESLIRIDVVNN